MCLLASALQVESSTDLRLLSTTDTANLTWRRSALEPDQLPPTRTADEKKDAGDIFYGKGWLISAEKSCSDGLALEPDHVFLRLNRAQTRLKRGHFRSVLNDALHVLALDRSIFSLALLAKELNRAVSAAYSLQLWQAAKRRYEEFLTAFPESKRPRTGWSCRSEDAEGRDGGVRLDHTCPFSALLIDKKWQRDPHVDLAGPRGQGE